MTVIAAIRDNSLGVTYMVSDTATDGGLRYMEDTKIWTFNKGRLAVGMAGSVASITEAWVKLKRRKQVTVWTIREAINVAPAEDIQAAVAREGQSITALVCEGEDMWVVDSDGAVVQVRKDETTMAVGAGADYVLGFLDATGSLEPVQLTRAVDFVSGRVPSCGGVSDVVEVEHRPRGGGR